MLFNNSPTYLNVPDQTGASPLMSACRKGKKKFVSFGRLY